MNELTPVDLHFNADKEGLPPELGCLGLLDGVDTLLLIDFEGELWGLSARVGLQFDSGFRTVGGPIKLELKPIILAGLPPLLVNFSSSRRRLRSFLSFSLSLSLSSDTSLVAQVFDEVTGVMVSELGMLLLSLLKGIISIPGRRSSVMLG